MVQLGYLLPTRESIMAGESATGRLVDLALGAEAAGYDSVWVGDSLFARARHEPLTLLAGVATRTSRVEVGTAVLLPALRNPVVLAQIVATLDQLAEGRVILGIGIGADTPAVRSEFAAAGVPFEQRVGRMVQGMRLCRALWTGEPVSWTGPYWELDGAAMLPTPARVGGPPIWVGGGVPAALARAGRLYDGWFPVGGGADGFGSGLAAVHAAAAEVGRDPADVTGAAYVTLAVDDDPAAAERQLETFLGDYYAPAPAAVMRRAQSCFAGSFDDALTYLRGFVDAGADHLCLRFCGDHEVNIERFAGCVG